MKDEIQLEQESELRAQANPFGGGLDWLEVRLPQSVPWRPQVAELFGSLRRGEERIGVKQSEHYAAVVDLRKYDIADAFLHVGKKRDEHSHKVQFVGTGQYSWNEHVADLEKIVDADPMKLEPMRTDLTVDIPDVSVRWAVENVRAAGKRFSSKYGRLNDDGDPREHFVEMGSRETQTYYQGRQPNCYRVYNKTAEREHAYRKFIRGWHPPEPTNFDKWVKQVARREGSVYLEFEEFCYQRGLHPDIELEASRLSLESLRPLFVQLHDAWVVKCAAIGPRPSFKDFCGMSESQMLTRFERQIGAQQIKGLYLVGDKEKRPIFGTLKELQTNVTEFNPFASLSISAPGRREPALPNGSNYSLTEYMAGMYIRDRIIREGRAPFEAWATPLAKGHLSDILKRFSSFLPPERDEDVRITPGELFERYRSAIKKQLAA